jgi:hypothetical protein
MKLADYDPCVTFLQLEQALIIRRVIDYVGRQKFLTSVSLAYGTGTQTRAVTMLNLFPLGRCRPEWRCAYKECERVVSVIFACMVMWHVKVNKELEKYGCLFTVLHNW